MSVQPRAWPEVPEQTTSDSVTPPWLSTRSPATVSMSWLTAGRTRSKRGYVSIPASGWSAGVNTKTKLIKRQMYGRAGFTLLRPRILLG